MRGGRWQKGRLCLCRELRAYGEASKVFLTIQFHHTRMGNITKIVDQQMAAPKQIKCTGFTDDNFFLKGNDYRATIPVLDTKGNSFDIPMELYIVCRTGWPLDEFNLVLLAVVGDGRKDKKDVCRLDFGESQEHRIHPKYPSPPNWEHEPLACPHIKGSHIHTWRHNRHLGSERMLPKKLPFAIPVQVSSWEEAFDLFCGECRISYDSRPHCRRGLI